MGKENALSLSRKPLNSVDQPKKCWSDQQYHKLLTLATKTASTPKKGKKKTSPLLT